MNYINKPKVENNEYKLTLISENMIYLKEKENFKEKEEKCIDDIIKHLTELSDKNYIELIFEKYQGSDSYYNLLEQLRTKEVINKNNSKIYLIAPTFFDKLLAQLKLRKKPFNCQINILSDFREISKDIPAFY